MLVWYIFIFLTLVNFRGYGVTLWYPTYVSELNAEREAEELKRYCNSSATFSGPTNLVPFCDCSSTRFEAITVSDQELKNWKINDVLFQNATFYNITFDSVLFNNTEFRDCKILNSTFIGAYFNSTKFIDVLFQSVDFLPNSVCISEDSEGELILDDISMNIEGGKSDIHLSSSPNWAGMDGGISTGCTAKEYTNMHCSSDDFRVYRDSFFVSAAALPGNIASAIAVYYLRRNHWLGKV